MSLQDLQLKYKELGEEIERLEAKPTGVWETEMGEEYWSVGFAGTTVKRTLYLNGGDYALPSLITHHNVYKTEKLARKASVLQRRSNLVIQACLNFDPDFEPDWNNHHEVKYQFYYGNITSNWGRSIVTHSNLGGACVSTKEKSDLVLEYLNSQEIK